MNRAAATSNPQKAVRLVSSPSAADDDDFYKMTRWPRDYKSEEDDPPTFIASPSFKGPKQGYVFTSRPPFGTGYHLDTPASRAFFESDTRAGHDATNRRNSLQRAIGSHTKETILLTVSRFATKKYKKILKRLPFTTVNARLAHFEGARKLMHEDCTLGAAKKWLKRASKLAHDHSCSPELVSISSDESEVSTEVEEDEEEEEEECEEQLWLDKDEEDPCEICLLDRNCSKQLICDECEKGFHMYCLEPPLESPPKDDEWYCPGCKVYLKAVNGRDVKRTVILRGLREKHATDVNEKRGLNEAIQQRNSGRFERRIARAKALKDSDVNFRAQLLSFNDMCKKALTLRQLVEDFIELNGDGNSSDEGDDDGDGDDDGVVEKLGKRQKVRDGR